MNDYKTIVMYREKIKEAAEVMLAFADGKKIEREHPNGKWQPCDAPLFDWASHNYRIKPEPKYRPFYTQEECWNEMMKHQPFEWIVNQVGNKAKILYIDTDFILIAEPCKIHSYDYNEALKYFKFADGTPFGILEE